MDLKGTIVFSSGKMGDFDIWTLNLETEEVSQLTSGEYWNDCPRWSPDGSKIVFTSSRTGSSELWLMNAYGAEQTQLTTGNVWNNSPSWSPCGTKITFCANYNESIDIYTINVDGTGLTRITDHPEKDFTPVFSPDGSKIVFTSKRSGNADVWQIDLETKELKQLTDHPGSDFAPVYSPDGKEIVFISGEPIAGGGEDLEIYSMNPDGSNQGKIIKRVGADRHVNFSPDGRYLIYTTGIARSSSDRMVVADMKARKSKVLKFDRTKLDWEIDAKVGMHDSQAAKGNALFQMFQALTPKWLVRLFCAEEGFGTDHFPDWKY